MRLLTANKILLASCAVAVPLSVYGGMALKERYLEREFARVPEDSALVGERAIRARIVQLEHERKELLSERANIDTKLQEVRQRQQAAQSPSA